MNQLVKSSLSLFILVLMGLQVFAQEQKEGDYFKVSFDAFSPPIQAMIKDFEGSTPMAFMSNDINGTEHYLKNYQGKVVFVYFWNGDCEACKEMVSSLNLLDKEENRRLQILSFADEDKEEAKELAAMNGIEFPVLYDGKFIGEAAYGIEIGYPRLFVLDKSGKVAKVFPKEALVGNETLYLDLKNFLNALSK